MRPAEAKKRVGTLVLWSGGKVRAGHMSYCVVRLLSVNTRNGKAEVLPSGKVPYKTHVRHLKMNKKLDHRQREFGTDL